MVRVKDPTELTVRDMWREVKDDSHVSTPAQRQRERRSSDWVASAMCQEVRRPTPHCGRREL